MLKHIIIINTVSLLILILCVFYLLITSLHPPATTPALCMNQTETADFYYIGNKNTGKFHDPSCSSIQQMKESNKEYLYFSRDEVIEKGYEPCRKCSP